MAQEALCVSGTTKSSSFPPLKLLHEERGAGHQGNSLQTEPAWPGHVGFRFSHNWTPSEGQTALGLMNSKPLTGCVILGNCPALLHLL